MGSELVGLGTVGIRFCCGSCHVQHKLDLLVCLFCTNAAAATATAYSESSIVLGHWEMS